MSVLPTDNLSIAKLAGDSLTPGKFADVVILDRDLFASNPSDLDKVKVSPTVVDGKVVYEGKR